MGKIFVKLTEDELRERGKKLAAAVSTLVVLEAGKKESAAKFNADIKETKQKIVELAETIRSGLEVREGRDADELPGVRKLRDANGEVRNESQDS